MAAPSRAWWWTLAGPSAMLLAAADALAQPKAYSNWALQVVST